MIFAVDFLQGDEGRDKGKVKTSQSGTWGYNGPFIVIAVQPLLDSHLGNRRK